CVRTAPFGCGRRRPQVAPLGVAARPGQHGLFLAATLASETTAAATGAVGVVRRDPFAMLPFCGYNMGDYFGHWLNVGARLKNPPRIFRVNWFRRDENGKFLWPGFGDNLRVLKWVIDRCQGKGGMVETPIGIMPTATAIDTEGLQLAPGTMEKLLAIDLEGWRSATRSQEEFFAKFGKRLPAGIQQEHDALKA